MGATVLTIQPYSISKMAGMAINIGWQKHHSPHASVSLHHLNCPDISGGDEITAQPQHIGNDHCSSGDWRLQLQGTD